MYVGKWQFFDMENDSYEMRNLIDEPEHLAQIQRHHRWLRDRIAGTGDQFVVSPIWGIEGWNAITEDLLYPRGESEAGIHPVLPHR